MSCHWLATETRSSLGDREGGSLQGDDGVGSAGRYRLPAVRMRIDPHQQEVGEKSDHS